MKKFIVQKFQIILVALLGLGAAAHASAAVCNSGGDIFGSEFQVELPKRSDRLYSNRVVLETIDTALEWGYLEFDGTPLDETPHSLDVIFLIKDLELLKLPRVRTFVFALQKERENIQQIYGLTVTEYFELARLTLGIMEVETNFGRSNRYMIKENLPAVVWLLKKVLSDKPTPNSRGLTQIKRIPEEIAEAYGIEIHELDDPYNAAIATMGYLADAIPWLKGLAAKIQLDSLTEDNFYDHLIYLYSGRSFEIINNSATPEQNLYIQKVRERKGSLVILYSICDSPVLNSL